MEYLESRYTVSNRFDDPRHIGAWSVGQRGFSDVGARANVGLYRVDTTGMDFD